MWPIALASRSSTGWIERDAIWFLQTPLGTGRTTGTFALRSPVRPNPIASSIVELVGIEGATLRVRGLDCVDGTPLLDLKPDYPTGSSKD